MNLINRITEITIAIRAFKDRRFMRYFTYLISKPCKKLEFLFNILFNTLSFSKYVFMLCRELILLQTYHAFIFVWNIVLEFVV